MFSVPGTAAWAGVVSPVPVVSGMLSCAFIVPEPHAATGNVWLVDTSADAGRAGMARSAAVAATATIVRFIEGLLPSEGRDPVPPSITSWRSPRWVDQPKALRTGDRMGSLGRRSSWDGWAMQDALPSIDGLGRLGNVRVRGHRDPHERHGREPAPRAVAHGPAAHARDDLRRGSRPRPRGRVLRPSPERPGVRV